MFVNYSVILKGDPTGDINTLDVKDDPNLKVLSWIAEHYSAHLTSACLEAMLRTLVPGCRQRLQMQGSSRPRPSLPATG